MLYNKIIALYPELTTTDFYTVITLQNDSDGKGDGNQELKSYYTPLDDVAGNGYYDIENNFTYYETVSEPIT